jgi:hypothetical protein
VDFSKCQKQARPNHDFNIKLQTICGKARNNAHAQKNYKQHTCWTRELQIPHIWTRKLQTPHKELQTTCTKSYKQQAKIYKQ